jgi:hypothetical protein
MVRARARPRRDIVLGGDVTTGEVVRFDITTGNKLISFNLPAGSGGVGGISIMPNVVGEGSLTVPNSSEVSPKVSGGKLPNPVPESAAGPEA